MADELETCVCGHQADEHDTSGECQAPDCPCWAIELDPESQTAPEVDWT